MKAIRPVAIVAALMLAGCASSGSSSSSAAGDSSWWNPLSWSWSSLSPTHWFGDSLSVSEQGVGAINGATPMTQSALEAALGGDYRLRSGMRGDGGAVSRFWQALDGEQVKLVIYGDSRVTRVEVMDKDITSADGSKIGDAVSQHYDKAFGHCQKAPGIDSSDIECKAPGSQHIAYVYHGNWHGPEGLIPSDDTLKSWTLSKIVWQK